MRLNNFIALPVLIACFCLMAVGCGGGDDEITTPPPPNPFDQGDNGDIEEPTIPGPEGGQYLADYGDLRGVAASRTYVYVADTTTLYGFDKLGNLMAPPVGLPATAQQVGVFPARPDVELSVDINDGLQIWNFPAVLHDPVSGYGCITIYGPNMDVFTTVEDAGADDLVKSFAMPDGTFDPPNPQSNWLIVRTYDMAIDRFGSVLFTADIDFKPSDPFPDYPRALVVLNRFNGYAPEFGGILSTVDDDDNPITVGTPLFHGSLGHALGALGTMTVDTYFPLNRTETEYTLYVGDADFIKDFVGVAEMRIDPVTMAYTVSQSVANPLGFVRVIGDTVGNDPGSFSLAPPLDPDGNLEDPDLTNGGPSGMTVDRLSDEVYICDPGNRRIQSFDPLTGAFLQQIGSGIRGNAGNAFLAPSELWIDEGLTFVCDVDQLRVIRDKLPDTQFGDVGGTVRRLDNGFAIPMALVTIGNELGTIAARQSNINGDYLIENLVTGTYYMTAGKFNYDSDTAEIPILPDITVRADFNLNPRTPVTTGSYTGTVVDDFSNVYIPDVLVEVVGTGLSATTDNLGRFEIGNIIGGTWQMRFSREDYITLTKDVLIVVGGTTNDFIEMDRE